MGASLCLCVCVQLGWGLILLFHSSRVTNRINSGLPTEQEDTLAALFKKSITGDGYATDPIVHQSVCIHSKKEKRKNKHKTSQFEGKLQPSVVHLIWASQAANVFQQQDNKVSPKRNFSCYFVRIHYIF